LTNQQALVVYEKGNALAELDNHLAGEVGDGLDVQVPRPHPAGTQQQGTI
jgi:hypothetical protein